MKVLFALALLVPALAFAKEGGTSDPQATDTGEQKLICKQERKIGSNRLQRVCKTAAQIEKEREMARQRMDDQRACDMGSC
jgi:hypothetical protein